MYVSYIELQSCWVGTVGFSLWQPMQTPAGCPGRLKRIKRGANPTAPGGAPLCLRALLWGGPRSAPGEMGERSVLASHSGYKSHFCQEGLVIVTVR